MKHVLLALACLASAPAAQVLDQLVSVPAERVLVTSPFWAPRIASTFSMREAWTNGPFFLDRDMGFSYFLAVRRRTIMRSVRLLLRVR